MYRAQIILVRKRMASSTICIARRMNVCYRGLVLVVDINGSFCTHWRDIRALELTSTSDATDAPVVLNCADWLTLLHPATFQQNMRNLRPLCAERVAWAFENGTMPSSAVSPHDLKVASRGPAAALASRRTESRDRTAVSSMDCCLYSIPSILMRAGSLGDGTALLFRRQRAIALVPSQTSHSCMTNVKQWLKFQMLYGVVLDFFNITHTSAWTSQP